MKLQALRSANALETFGRRARQIQRSLIEYGDQPDEFNLMHLADLQVGTKVCEALDERGCSGGMRFQLHTAYLRILGFLLRMCTMFCTVGPEVISLLTQCREIAAADRRKEGVRARLRTVPELIDMGKWLPDEQHARLERLLEQRLRDAVDRPPRNWQDRLEFQDVLITWVHACRHHSAQRVQVHGMEGYRLDGWMDGWMVGMGDGCQRPPRHPT
jgi:hypothetical protein